MIEERETTLPGAATAGSDPRPSTSPSASPSESAMRAAREELALVSAQLNDGHTQLIALMRPVLAQDLWCGVGFRSPEQWLTAYAGLTWSSAHDIVRIAGRCAELPTMQRLLEEGRLTLGLAAVIAKYTPAAYDADVAEFASYTTVTQLRRALSRYQFHADTPPDTDTEDSDSGTNDNNDDNNNDNNNDSTPDSQHDQDGASAFLPGDAADDTDRVEDATDAAQSRAPGPFDPATAPPRLRMRYADGRFHLTYDAPADIGALVEQALLEAKDTLFHLHTRTMSDPQPANTPTPPGGFAPGDFPPSDFPPGDPSTGGAASTRRPGTTACGDNHGDATRSHRGASFGEALSLLAQRSLDAGAPLGHSRASRYRIYLHLDTGGNGWLHKQAALPPALRERVLCDGIIQPVWETEGTPVNVGRAQRIVPARTRRLLEDRDRGCRFPGCLTLHHLECHHLDHWIHGGHTDAERMIMLCPFHHDEHHRGAFIMVGDPTKPDGITFTARDGTRLRPDYRDYRPPGDSTSERTGDSSNEIVDSSNEIAGSGRDSPTPWTPYPGPTNERLHLSIVRFDARPPPGMPDR